MALTKATIAESIQNELDIQRNQSVEVVETVLEIIKRSLESGEDVMVSGFGKFCVKEKSERKGRNPATGEDMMLPPRKVITFNCSRSLRERMNGNR